MLILAVGRPGWLGIAEREVAGQPGFTVAGLLGSAGGEPSAASRESGEGRGRPDLGFRRAYLPREFKFPADHGSHPEYQTEWWYFTGNLASAEGREFGFQLTFFRFGLSPADRAVSASEVASRVRSRWRANQIYMAHFALTDVQGQRFYSAEKFQREALHMAGAQANPFAVWLGPWRAASLTGQPTLWPLRLSASTSEFALNLTVRAAKPLVRNGDRGLSRKNAVAGNASYYYSFTRLPAAGTVTVAGTAYDVGGLAWMDREWSTSALAPDQAGWDWFALQLSDGSDLMVYFLRRKDGSIDPFSAGSLVNAHGAVTKLSAQDLRLRVREHWTSSRGGVVYPAGWRLRTPTLDLEISPKVSDQEMHHSVRYWEGAVKVHGRSATGPVSGHGYVELAGY